MVSTLSASDGPLSAAEIHEALRGRIPLSSLYRSLTVLEETGIVDPHNGVRGITRYELGEWLAGHHHHLVCVVCGSVEDISLPSEMETRLEAIVEETVTTMSFRAGGHSLEVQGRCRTCR